MMMFKLSANGVKEIKLQNGQSIERVHHIRALIENKVK